MFDFQRSPEPTYADCPPLARFAYADASTARAHCVSPPWLCRVNSIWFVPGDRASSHLEPKGTLPEVREWERTQIEQGRIAVHHFELQVNSMVGEGGCRAVMHTIFQMIVCMALYEGKG